MAEEEARPPRSSALLASQGLWKSAGSIFVCSDPPCTCVDALDTPQAHIFYPSDTTSYTKQLFWMRSTSALRALFRDLK